MPKGNTHEFRGKFYSEIPQEIVDKLNLEPGKDVEFKNPYGDLVIIVPQKETQEKGLPKDKMKVLKKVGKIKHWKRTPENIEETLEEKEEDIFNEMITENILFEYEKEGEKRIGIDKEYFPLVKENNEKKEIKGLIDKLEEQGYLILENKNRVEKLQNKLREKDKGDEVKGVRDFDKKYYIINKERLSDLEQEIEKTLEEEKIIHEITKDLGIKEDLCKTALVVLREEGKVVEKGKDIYEIT